MQYVLFLLIAIFGVNLITLIFRRSRVRRGYRKAKDDRARSEKEIEDVKRRLKYEQEDAVRRVELRNRTLEMYEQVRRNAEDTNGADSGEEDESV